jgi:hypothetical protein
MKQMFWVASAGCHPSRVRTLAWPILSLHFVSSFENMENMGTDG